MSAIVTDVTINGIINYELFRDFAGMFAECKEPNHHFVSVLPDEMYTNLVNKYPEESETRVRDMLHDIETNIMEHLTNDYWCSGTVMDILYNRISPDDVSMEFLRGVFYLSGSCVDKYSKDKK